MKSVLITFFLFLVPAVLAGVAWDMGFVGTAFAFGSVATLVCVLLPWVHEGVKA